MMNEDDFYHANIIKVTFDKEREMLIFYDVYSNGEQDLYTQVELSWLQTTDIDTTCQAVVKIILARLPSIREALFKR